MVHTIGENACTCIGTCTGVRVWRIVAERSRAQGSSAGVSDQQIGVRVPVLTLVSLSKTLYHYCCVFRMGRKAVGPVCCVTHVKEPIARIVMRRGFAAVFLAWLAAKLVCISTNVQVHSGKEVSAQYWKKTFDLRGIGTLCFVPVLENTREALRELSVNYYALYKSKVIIIIKGKTPSVHLADLRPSIYTQNKAVEFF